MKILITGASQGIGLAIAKQLYAEGHNLFLLARNSERLDHVLQSFGEGVIGTCCNLGDPQEIHTAQKQIAEHDFLPDVLILNAAEFGPSVRSVLKPAAQELRDILEINLLANYQLVQGFLESLKRSSYPRIIIVGSTASIRTDDNSLYGISKWALRAYTYFLRNELKDVGIGVTLLNPGGTFTQKRKPNQNTSADRLLNASDIAKTAAYILNLSPQAVVEEMNVRPMQGDTY